MLLNICSNSLIELQLVNFEIAFAVIYVFAKFAIFGSFTNNHIF